MGVLRPHVLRYKGKLRKVDPEKLKHVQKQQETLKDELSKTKAVPKMNFIVVVAGLFIFSGMYAPLLSFYAMMLIHFLSVYSSSDVLSIHEEHRVGDEGGDGQGAQGEGEGGRRNVVIA